MPRSVDPKRTRKAQKRVARLGALAPPEGFSAWEQEFLTALNERLDTYGSAFNDGSKGALDDALSRLQDAKLREIAAKARAQARGKPEKKPGGFGRRAPPRAPRDDS